MRRTVALMAGIVALGCAAMPATAGAPPVNGALVTFNGGAGQRFLSADALKAANGDVRTMTPATFAELMGARAASVVRLAVEPQDGRPPVVLTGEEVRGGDAYFDVGYGSQVAFHPSGGGVPIVNASGENLHVSITTTGRVLVVTARADPDHVDAGQRVRFRAASDAPDGEEVTYSWLFDDGDVAEGGDVDHAFAADGAYLVTATAVAQDGATGISMPVRVQVGTPAPAPPGAADQAAPPPEGPMPVGSGTEAGPGSSAGPAGGGTAGPSAPTRGPAKAVGGPSSSPSDRSPADRADRGDRAHRTARAHADDPPRAAAAAPVPAPALPPDEASAPGAASPAPRPSTRGSRRADSRADPRGRTDGVAVRGTLLSLENAASVGERSAKDPASAAREAARAGGGGGSADPWATVGGVAVLLLLLAVGAALERPRPRPLAPP